MQSPPLAIADLPADSPAYTDQQFAVVQALLDQAAMALGEAEDGLVTGLEELLSQSQTPVAEGRRRARRNLALAMQAIVGLNEILAGQHPADRLLYEEDLQWPCT